MTKATDNYERLRRNAESKLLAENDGQPWGDDELDILMLWDRTEAELDAVAELLGRTREACRERYYKARRGFTMTRTTTTTTTIEYRGWTESMGDGDEA